jgi:hypothetical protein
MHFVSFPARAALIVAAVFISLSLASAPARAKVQFNFSGGGGGGGGTIPLSMTLAQPVSYTLTAPGNGPFFIIDGAGNTYFGNGFYLSGSITFSIDGGPPLVVESVSSGATASNVTRDDHYYLPVPQGPPNPSAQYHQVSAGSTITLSAGTLTTTGSPSLGYIPGPIPTSGLYETFLVDFPSGTRISTFGVSVPEPASISLLAAGAFALAARRPRLRR